MRKITIFALATLLIAAVSVYSQDQRWMPRNEERFKEILKYRIVEVTDALNLELTSEKGRRLVDLINNKAESMRNIYMERGEKQRSLYQELKNETIDEQKVEQLVLDIERLQAELYSIHVEYDRNVKEILTPVERAHLFVAEERFKNRLQRAMRDHRKNYGGPGDPRKKRK